MIKILDRYVANKIAAGEVVERPLSVVKEAVENSIDAGASSIIVEIKNGGKSYIRVTDDGSGISPDEVLLAFKRHATSKIENESDLEKIETLGFRGEALASIAAISRVELVTKKASEKLGKRVVISGGTVIDESETGCPDGTTLIITDLFFNTPARLKFMKSDKAESSVIIDFVSKMALAYPGLKFRLINNDNILFSTNGKGDLKTNILTIYGREIAGSLVPVNHELGYAIVKGYVSSPAFSRTSRKYQIFFVNGRNVTSRVMEEGVSRAYSDRLFEGRYPSAFLFLETAPDKLDVNIHPNKKEVKFDDNSIIIDVIENGIKEALAVKEALPDIKVKNIFTEENLPEKPEMIFQETGEREIYTEDKRNQEQIDIKNILSTMREEEIRESVNEPYVKEELDITVPPPFDFSEITIKGSIFQTYVLFTDASCFYMLDQHAAHERIFFEKFMNEWHNSEKMTQELLTPFILEMPQGTKEAVSENMNVLNEMGFVVEEFGPRSYVVKAVPAFMGLEEAKSFLDYYADNTALYSTVIDKPKLEKLAMRACKSAVKGGDLLKTEELEKLISDLSKCRNPYSCPHGRPTFIKLTKYEIEKLFKRV